jgi:hypothetical protein
MTELCDCCDVNPSLPGYSLCRQCLQARLAADRRNAEAQRQLSQERIKDEKARRDWQRPL